MARNGGAQGMWWLARNIANATCTVAATVQESLWKFPHPPPPTVLVEVMEELLVVAAVPQRLKPLYPLLLRCWPVGSISIVLGLPLISTNSITGIIFILRITQNMKRNFFVFVWFLSMKWHKPSSDLLNGRYNIFLHFKLICQLNDLTSELSSSLV